MDSAKPRLVFIGYTNIDVNITPVSKTVLPGGGAYFGAVAASLFLRPIGLVSRIGKEYDADFLLSRVLPEGLCVDPQKPTATSTQTYFSESDLTERKIELEWGVAPDVNPIDFPGDWFESAEWVHISTMPPAQQAAFIPFIRKQMPQAKLSIDTDYCFFDNKADLKKVKKNFSQVDFAFANRKEYEFLKKEINILPKAIVKYDKDGAYFLQNGKKKIYANTKQVKVEDATGAGDILAGVFIAAKMLGETDEQALEKAVSIATKSVEEIGVSHLFKDFNAGHDFVPMQLK